MARVSGRGGGANGALDGHCPGLRAGLPRAGEGRLRRAVLCLSACIPLHLPGVGAAQPGPLPSGQEVASLDRGLEVQADGARWLVLRYLAPRIAREGGDLDYDAVQGDLDRLCETEGLSFAAEEAAVDQIVIVLLDRPIPRGTADPDVRQFIGAYVPTEAGCEWE